MASYITTYGGTHFTPTEPKKEDLHITDIAHSLSMLCRGNGHVKTFFSVGQHCIHCAMEAQARGYSKRIILACLLHDASEAYMSDVPRPFKQELPDYKKWEDALLDIIYEKYLGTPLSAEETALVKEVDDDRLSFAPYILPLDQTYSNEIYDSCFTLIENLVGTIRFPTDLNNKNTIKLIDVCCGMNRIHDMFEAIRIYLT